MTRAHARSNVLVAMSGGVDSSVAAALLVEQGHDVVGATLKLWGGASDSGCCSVADTDDARRVADVLGIAHHVFNLSDEFDEAVVSPYVQHHAIGLTPNPCVECNRKIKFGLLLDRARRLGFDLLATGHHARAVGPRGERRLLRAVDLRKDQSYVLAMLSSAQLDDLVFPVGSMTKAQVRAKASSLGLRNAQKPDSQEVCFIHSATGRASFLGARIALHGGDLVEARSGATVGTVPAVELVTVGQRRGLGSSGGGGRMYALSVDVEARRVTVGGSEDASTKELGVRDASWVGRPLSTGEKVLAQTSAHGKAAPCAWAGDRVVFDEPHPLVASGQTVALYEALEPDAVVGCATAT